MSTATVTATGRDEDSPRLPGRARTVAEVADADADADGPRHTKRPELTNEGSDGGPIGNRTRFRGSSSASHGLASGTEVNDLNSAVLSRADLTLGGKRCLKSGGD